MPLPPTNPYISWGPAPLPIVTYLHNCGCHRVAILLKGRGCSSVLGTSAPKQHTFKWIVKCYGRFFSPILSISHQWSYRIGIISLILWKRKCKGSGLLSVFRLNKYWILTTPILLETHTFSTIHCITSCMFQGWLWTGVFNLGYIKTIRNTWAQKPQWIDTRSWFVKIDFPGFLMIHKFHIWVYTQKIWMQGLE